MDPPNPVLPVSAMPSAMVLSDLAPDQTPAPEPATSQVNVLTASQGAEGIGRDEEAEPAGFKARARIDYSRPLQDRICFFLDEDLGTDVEFLVGESGTGVRAHKIILGSASPVFFSMFFSEGLESETEVRIPDCEPDTFKALLHFIYRGKIPDLLLMDRSAELLYVARKYCIRPLEDDCSLHLASSVSFDTVFEIMGVAGLFELPALSAICWDYVQDSTAEVLRHNLAAMETDMLVKILDNDHLNISELEIFQLVLKWGELEASRSGSSLATVLEPVIRLVRFPAIFPHDLADHVVPTGILTSDQIARIYTHIYASDESKRPVLEFKSSPRTPLLGPAIKRRPKRYGVQNHPDQNRPRAPHPSARVSSESEEDLPGNTLAAQGQRGNGSGRRRSRRNRNRNHN